MFKLMFEWERKGIPDREGWIQQSKWPKGPWTDEPDVAFWIDAATKLPCLLVRNRMGSFCGYVQVPPTHSLYKESGEDLDVHGGVTFNGPIELNPENKGYEVLHGVGETWWIGFDTAHCFDLMPAMGALGAVIEEAARRAGEPVPEPPVRSLTYENGTYRDVYYMVAEVTRLAAQIAALPLKEEMGLAPRAPSNNEGEDHGSEE